MPVDEVPRAAPRSDGARVRRDVFECITPTREGSGQTRTVTCTALFGCSVHRLLPAMLGVAGAVHAGVDRVMMPRNRHHNTVSMHRLLWLVLVVVPRTATATDGACVRRSGPGVVATHARWSSTSQFSSRRRVHVNPACLSRLLAECPAALSMSAHVRPVLLQAMMGTRRTGTQWVLHAQPCVCVPTLRRRPRAIVVCSTPVTTKANLCAPATEPGAGR